MMNTKMAGTICEGSGNARATVSLPRDAFALSVRFIAETEDQEMLTLGETLHLQVAAGVLTVDIHTPHSFRGDERIFTTHLTMPEVAPGPHEALVLWYGHWTCLYCDGRLVDEEWPLGNVSQAAQPLTTSAQVEAYTLAHANPPDDEDRTQTFAGPAQFFAPPGHNTGAGDCMPFFHDGRYRLFYLFDRRQHRSKDHLGAHQWAQLSSADLRTWTLHPMAVGITDQMEGSICTGSMIEREGVVYAFYAVRMSDGSAAQMTWATSRDGVHFQKSGCIFTLTSPYEPVSARDPKVFQDDEGLYHMLVTTNLADRGTHRYAGCLAHLTSLDLLDWTQHEPLIVPGYADQPECTDYFAWNGWYYLVFSHYAIAHYRMSRSPLGPWSKPRYDLLDALEVQVPKTAPFHGNRRLSSGFLARYPRTYAGNIITHELFQRTDGTLGVKFLEEILPDLPVSRPVETDFQLCSNQGRDARELGQESDFRLRATFVPGAETVQYGLELYDDQGLEYRLIMDVAARMVRIQRPREDMSMGEARNQLTDMELTGPVALDCLVWGDMMDIAFDCGRAMTLRFHQASKRSLRLFALCGTVSVQSLQLHAR